MKEPENELSLSRNEFWGTIGALQIILLLAALDQTVIATAMPKIVEQLGGFDRYAWATTGYLLTSTIAVPVLGKVSDLYGRKRTLLWGVAWFAFASVLCALAGMLQASPIDGMEQLIWARVLQGIGGGAIVGLSFSVVGDLLPPAVRGKYQGLFAAVFAFASIIGPALGGYVTDVSTWRWLFLINVPLGLAGMFLFAVNFRERTKREGGQGGNLRSKLDLSGITVFCAATTFLLVGLDAAAHRSVGNFAWLWLLAAVIAFLIFARIEHQTKDPFLPLGVLGDSTIIISAVSLGVTGVGMFGSTLLVPLFFQCVFGMSAAKSGALLGPLVINVAVFSIVGGYWMTKARKYKSVILTGLGCMTVGVFLLSTINQHSSIALILSFMFFVGIGLGLLLPIYTVVIQNAVCDELLGTVTGLSQFFRSIGGTIGVASFGTLMLYFYNARLPGLLPSHLPQAVMLLFDNPLSPHQMAVNFRIYLQSHADSHLIVGDLIQRAQTALVSAIDSVFLIYAVILLGVWCLNLFLAELPLRSAKTHSSIREKSEQLGMS